MSSTEQKKSSKQSLPTINGQFKLLHKLGSGSFGDVFKAVDLNTKKEVAVKLEKKSARHPVLMFEGRCYKKLQGIYGIPVVHWSGVQYGHNILVMDLCGSSLEDVFNMCGRKFSLKTVLLLADQMLQRTEAVHEANFLHRDIKPDNFLVGHGKDANVVNIVDFGLAKKYMDSRGEHIPFRTGKSLTGTARYASVNTHEGLEQGRRDDLEALAYVWLYFLRGSLPWQGLPVSDKRKKYVKIMEKKKEIPIQELVGEHPREFAMYLQYCRNLGFTDKPDYAYLRNLFRGLYMRMGYDEEKAYFDWTLKAMRKAAQDPTKKDEEPVEVAHPSAPASPLETAEDTEEANNVKPVPVPRTVKVE